MSFYGNIKRVNSSPFVFDRYFPSRYDMEEKLKNTNDGVYVGRFVLIRYDCDYIEGTTNLEFFNQWEDWKKVKETSEEDILVEDPRYLKNWKKDLEEYGDTFNGTVWQKIYTTIDGSSKEKYIMVAELNSDVPKMNLKITSPKILISENEEQWIKPKIGKDAYTSDTLVITMPDALHLDVEDFSGDYYGTKLLNPAKLPQDALPDGVTLENAFSKDYNYIKWERYKYLKDDDGNILSTEASAPGDNIDEKRLDMKLFGFGAAISQIYNALYGVPNENDPEGKRPFYTNKDIQTPDNKGLVGILTSIGAEAKGDLTQDTYSRTMNNGMYYYFISKWGSPNEDPKKFIENIPDVVGASENYGGSSAASQCYIKFDAEAENEGELPQYIVDWE